MANSPPLGNFYNNHHVPPIVVAGPSGDRLLDVTTPHDGSVIARVCLSSAADVDAAVKCAHTAFASWSALTSKSRVQYLLKFNQLVQSKYKDELAHLIVREHGKTYGEAVGEIMKGLETLEYAACAPQLTQGRMLEVSRGVVCHDERRPLGVCASIVPFNFPFMVPFWTLGHVIATGNTLVLKPSEKVPMTMFRVMEIWKECGLPDGVVNLVNGSVDAVNALCDHPFVKCVTFVGTSHVAELVSKRCRNLNKRVLALGGAKNHLVAAPDCNLDMTAQDVVSSFAGCAGQRCMAASVLLTIGERSDLIDLIVKKASELKPGSEAGCMGPVIDQPSKEKILRYINDAESKYGGTVLLDGRPWTSRGAGFWIGPTVILCKSPHDPAMTDEIFGPVLSVYACTDIHEAIKIENANPYGNAACIYTESGKTAEWFLSRFSAGMLGCNIGIPVPREPFSFGGINASKYGDFDITGDAAFELFTYRKKVTTKWCKPDKQTWLN
eukprot:Partr_v1_DN26260_c0_g1_i2_m48278 putative Dehydrogenase